MPRTSSTEKVTMPQNGNILVFMGIDLICRKCKYMNLHANTYTYRQIWCVCLYVRACWYLNTRGFSRNLAMPSSAKEAEQRCLTRCRWATATDKKQNRLHGCSFKVAWKQNHSSIHSSFLPSVLPSIIIHVCICAWFCMCVGFIHAYTG